MPNITFVQGCNSAYFWIGALMVRHLAINR